MPWFYTGEPEQFPLTTVAQTTYSTQRYDAFGRQVETTQLDGIVSLRTRYHALSTDMFDAGDLQPGPYQGTPASGQKDGHGRVVRTTERVKVGGTIEERYVDTTYLPSGEVKTITRRRGSDSVVRWMRYDSLGRMVWNVEPSTSKPFNPDPNTPGPDVLLTDATTYTARGTVKSVTSSYGDLVTNIVRDAEGKVLETVYGDAASTNSAKGNFGDGVIGAQALHLGIPLVTGDKGLAAAVEGMGGTARSVPKGRK